MRYLDLSIDGVAARIPKGSSILAAARTVGVDIPTLCHLNGLMPLGGCRICLVEVAGRPRPLPACATAAEQGMEVTTDSERLQTMRRMLLELLLAERNHTCPVCVMNGACQLQSLAKRFGIDHVRFGFLWPQVTVDISHRRFGMDHNRCILCRRCVRVCDEVEGAHVWDVRGRGVASLIISGLDEPWRASGTCTDCGKCVQVCPTGALFEKGAEPTVKEPACLSKIVDWRERRPK